MALAEATPDVLARLLEWESQALEWRPDDLGAFLNYQLRVPFLFDEKSVTDSGVARHDPVSPAGVATLGDLFRHPEPGVERLDLVRRFAKANLTDAAATLPPDAARVIYYCTIALARLRHGVSISRLTDAELLEGLRWARCRGWLDEVSSGIVDEGIALLTA